MPEGTMSSTAQTITQSASKSEAELIHPVARFLGACHLDLSSFPQIKLIFEINEKRLRTGRIVLPLRVPGDTINVYHSYARILRVLELPIIDQTDHRKFVEVEWNISTTPLTEDQYHLAMSFVAQDVICRICHDVFSPDPAVVSDREIQIECPHCRETWRVFLAPNVNPNARTPAILDEHKKDPILTVKKLRDWASRTSLPPNTYFPYEFTAWTSTGGALDFIFDDTLNSFTALSTGGVQTFESLMRGFINHLAQGFLLEGNTTNAQELETTEVQRKQEIQTETRKDLEPTPVPTAPAQKKLVRPPSPAHTKITTHRSKANPKPRFSLMKIAASFLFIAIFFGIGWTLVSQFQRSNPSIAQISVPKSESPAAPIAKPTEDGSKAEADPQFTELTSRLPEIEPIADGAPRNNEPATPAPPLQKPKKVSTAPKEPDWTQELDAAFRQGMLHLKMQQGKQAIEEFKKALALDPKHAESYRGLGLAFVYEQNYSEAIAAFESYLQRSNAKAPDRASVKQLLETLKERAL